MDRILLIGLLFSAVCACLGKPADPADPVAGERLSLYQSVFQFSPTSNAVVLVKGDTVSGCKLVLLDRVRHKTCCFSAPEREETMCEPSIQSGGCRSLESLKVEEHPGYCKIVFFKIKIEDAGPYLVIFPGKVNDNEQFDIKVSDDSEERILPGLPPVSDISRFEEVEDFVEGTTATVSVLGNTQSGCKFLFHTCCFSSTSRKDTLCHPDTQGGACRTKERFRVDELPDSCLLTLPNIDEDDVGSYKAIFPGKLLDNLKIKVALKKATDIGIATTTNACTCTPANATAAADPAAPAQTVVNCFCPNAADVANATDDATAPAATPVGNV